MDQKRTKFSPSTINDLEQAVVNQLVGLREGNRYSVPEEYRGRAQTAWDSLVEAFPVPPSISLSSIRQRFNTVRPMYDCFLPPSFNCICYKCLVATAPDITYYHEIMEQAEIEDTDETPISPHVCSIGNGCLEFQTTFLSSVVHTAHFYTDYVYVPGTAAYDEVPLTPTFTRVRFNAPASCNEEQKRKYVQRMRITPTRLFF
jgi:hypothetical protein